MPTTDSEDRSRAAEFERFFRTEYPVVVRIAQAIVRDAHLAEDVAQDAFLAMQRRFPEPLTSPHASAWVKIAATHLGLNALRSERRRDARERRERPAVGASGPEESVLQQEERAQMRAALARLPRHAATVLVLRHSGLSYAEVAEAMGVRIGQVGTMLRRAESKLRKEVNRAAHS